MSCEEALKDNTLSARHAVEEAMTEAMIRKCKYVYWLRVSYMLTFWLQQV